VKTRVRSASSSALALGTLGALMLTSGLDVRAQSAQGIPPGTASESRVAAADAPADTGDSSIRFSGFVDGVAAYTYSDPTHCSRAVARLYVAAQGKFGEDVRWKASGRVDGDAVYATSNFYLPDVKRDQRLDFFWGETYVDFAAGDWDFRLGAQQIVWGEVVGLFYADVVSARDMRDFLLPGFDVIRIPQWAARAEYTRGDSHLELVWIPVPAFDRIGEPGSEFYPARLPSPTPSQLASLFRDPVKPSRTIDNSSVGIRANTLVGGWDIAAFYYHSFSTEPTFYRVPDSGNGQGFAFEPRFDRISQTGATVTKDLGEVVLRGEAVYTHGRGYTLADLTAPEDVVRRSTLDYVISAEFSLPGETRLNVQGFQRIFVHGNEDPLAVKTGGVGATVLISTKLTNELEPQLLWIQNFAHAGGMVRPRLNWYPVGNTRIGFGVDVFTGPDDGYFGRYNNRDRVYADIRYTF
jgi:hypothetical protein